MVHNDFLTNVPSPLQITVPYFGKDFSEKEPEDSTEHLLQKNKVHLDHAHMYKYCCAQSSRFINGGCYCFSKFLFTPLS